MSNTLTKVFQQENFETSTAYIINRENLSDNAYNNLRSKLSILEFRTEEEIPKAFFEEHGYIFIPKIDLNVLFFIVGKKLMFSKTIPEHLCVKKPYTLLWKPMEHQTNIIKEGSHHLLNDDDKRLCICLAPGLGKTFCTSAIVSKLQCKFIFLVYSTKIIDQSIKAMKDHLGSERGFYKLSNSADILELRYDKIEGLFMTHAMFKSLVKNYGIERINKIIFEDIGINLKVLDEFDREVGNMYYMDSMMGFRYGIYLTGTKFKSLKPDDRLFQLVFRKVKTLGHDIKLPANKDALMIHWNFNPSSKEHLEINRDEGTFKIFYNNYMAQKDVLLDYIMQKFYYDSEVSREKNESKLFNKMLKEKGQIQFFCGRIENCSTVADKLINRFGIDPNDVGILNSSVTDRQKAKAIDKPFLVTTTQSLGRGVDSEMVRVLVLLEFHFSLSELLQIQARCGRIGKKFGYFIYPVDHSFTKLMMSYNSKVNQGVFRDGFKDNYHFRIPDEMASKYINGYDPESPRAKEIIEKKLKNNKKSVSKEIVKAFSHFNK
ncbi:MAG: DEAD/DEAH box helicase family protein [Sarcina sp.]